MKITKNILDLFEPEIERLQKEFGKTYGEPRTERIIYAFGDKPIEYFRAIVDRALDEFCFLPTINELRSQASTIRESEWKFEKNQEKFKVLKFQKIIERRRVSDKEVSEYVKKIQKGLASNGDFSLGEVE